MHCRLPASRADEGPSRRTVRIRNPSRRVEQPHRQGGSRPNSERCDSRRAEAALSFTGTHPVRIGFSPAENGNFPFRRRRGALHFPMGARFSPGIRRASRIAGTLSERAVGSPDRHGRRGHPRRYPETIGNSRGKHRTFELRPAEPEPFGKTQLPQTGKAFRNRAFHPKEQRGMRHRLLPVPKGNGDARPGAEPVRNPGRGLPRRAFPGGAHPHPGRFSKGRHPGDMRHHRVRHGNRQIEHPLRHPLQHAQEHGRILPGNRTGGPRRNAVRHASFLFRFRHGAASQVRRG